MNAMQKLAGVTLMAIVVAGAGVAADVKTQERTRIQFGGVMGGIVNLFGGEAAREGVVSTVTVRGDRKMTVTDKTAELIDLAEERIYEIDLEEKTYTVTTFADLQRRIEAAQEGAREELARAEDAPAEPESTDEEPVEFEVDFDQRESGQTRTINGYETREVVTIVTVREKGKTLEDAGGIVITSHTWLAPRIAAMDEVAAFDRRYAEQLALPLAAGASAEEMAAAVATYPGLAEAMGRFETENVNVDGTAILTEVTVEAVKSEADRQGEAEAEEEEPSRGFGGFRRALGGLGRRIARQQTGDDDGRTTVISTTVELQSVSTDVTATDVAIPEGFRHR